MASMNGNLGFVGIAFTSIVKKYNCKMAPTNEQKGRCIYRSSAIIRHSFHPHLNREDSSVSIELFTLIPNVNLNPPWPQPVYRLVFSISVVDDLEDGSMDFTRLQRTKALL